MESDGGVDTLPSFSRNFCLLGARACARVFHAAVWDIQNWLKPDHPSARMTAVKEGCESGS